MTAPAAPALLPHAVPASPDLRILLYAVRRMAAGGLADAHAAHALFTHFGLHFRRPLVLLRALVAEMSRASATQITVAPCCCPRMSGAERAITDALVAAGPRPDEAHAILAGLLQVERCAAVLGCAQAVASCLADLGHEL